MSFNTKKLVSIIVSAAMLFSLSGFNVLAEEAVDEESIMVNEAIVEEATESNAVEKTEEATEIEMIETTADLTENIENNYVGETINSNELTVTSTVFGGVIFDEYNGMGTAQYPYKIRTAEQFMSIGTKGYVTEANDRIYSWDAYYILMNDIEVSSDDYIPIGNHYGNFTGTFDGDGHTIYFTYNGGDYQGLFGVNSGTIKNLTVSGDVTGGYNFGMLVGENNGIIENCFTSGTVSGRSCVGGMVGLGSGTITASGSDATVTGTAIVGGLVGGSSSGTILNCYALGNVSHVNGGGSEGFGGLVGGAGPYGISTVIRNCYAAGEVGGGSGGGLIGLNNDNNPYVYNSYYHNINRLNGKGFPVTAEELKDASTFYMWDFDNIWAIDESGYPYIDLRGETPEVEFEGEGTEKSPYLIETEKHLHALAMKENGIEEGVYYRLENDIEVTAKFWMPINSYPTSYSGTFDGNGHTISGISILGINKRIGLFATNGLNGVIKNLTVSGNVKNIDGTYGWGNDATGILVGYNYGTVENCFSTGTADGENVGGLIGINDAKGTIRYCGSGANVTSSYSGGGLVSENHGGTIINSYAHGNISGGSEGNGGLVARNDGTVKYCYASGMVNDGNGGGLVGSAGHMGYSSGKIYNSYYHCVNTLNTKGFPATADELKNKNTYYMWDFDNVWKIDKGGYPYIDIRGETPAVIFEGDGDADSPYLIKTERQLYALSMDEASIGSGIYYQLANDIKVTAKFWTPICLFYDNGNGKEFKGVFDGNGYTISGIKNDAIAYYLGLFGVNGGTIKNLKVSGDFDAVLDRGYAGGNAGLLVAENISGAVVENCYSEGTVKGRYYIGGLVGCNYGTVKTSGSSATVEGISTVGGLVGNNQGTIINSYAQGDVTATESGGGGLAGDHGDNRVIKNCYSTGLVNGGSGYCLVGRDSNRDMRIYNSYTINTNNSSNNEYYMNGFIVSEEELKDKSTYYMWDFDNIWAIDEGGYPYINKRGETPAVTFEGDGDADSPYLIKTEEQLHALAMGNASVADGIHYQLANNIELTAKYWTPICMDDEFKATFDGNGFTVSGVKSSLAWKWVGLFGKNNGTIKNLNVTGAIASPSNSNAPGGNALLVASNKSDGVIEGCSATGTVKGADKVGVLVSENYGIIKDSTASGEAIGNDRVGLIAGYNNKTVENCVASGTAEGRNTIGGLIGENTNNGSITGSGAEATVKGASTIGGLAGYSDGKITDCYARGSVTATGDTAGGLVGRVGRGYNSNATISNSNSISEVSSDENVGGLVGETWGKIDSSFAKGTAAGTTNVGGLVGLLQRTSLALSGSDVDVVGNNNIGGLIGRLSYSSVTNSYAHGDVTGTISWGNVGGLIGYNDDSAVEYCYATGTVSNKEDLPSHLGGLVGNTYRSSVSNSYYDTETTGMSDTDKGIGMTTAQMKDATSYEGWDFADTWAISNDTNDGYPYLRALTPDFGKGDVNGDKSIDNKDATYLLRYLAGWTIPGLAQKALDVDGSDEVDNKDATILLRYLAGWDITLN